MIITHQIQSQIPARLRSWSARIEAKSVARRVLAPLVPAGKLQWLAFPRAGESARAYAHRAVYTAAARSSWAGGLVNGITAYDTAVVRSASRIAGGAR